ncbi:hypothetical protein GCM10010245_82510 [Streptomyces spectabilis]|uniref:Uncharacterized protein n=1 Tax=Streptomyces spectabilis TaxID=68270 RepID=A0A7W8B3L1_STRST|nr:hypothetical protein [Streptomyces spectabilis]GGV52408.1 hypothetical protein GCM10010245_82510 [Streptomyces spectabilis]
MASKGKLPAVPLTAGPHRAAHVEPDAPRVIQEWNGTEWETIGLAENLSAAKALLHPPQPVKDKPAEWDRPNLGVGRGRHRWPAPNGGRLLTLLTPGLPPHRTRSAPPVYASRCRQGREPCWPRFYAFWSITSRSPSLITSHSSTSPLRCGRLHAAP